MGLLPDEDGETVVPFDDKRTIRRVILDRKSSAMTNTKREELGRERLHDFGWSVASNVLSAVIFAVILLIAGEITGVNERLFSDVDCSDLSQAQAQALYEQDRTIPHTLNTNAVTVFPARRWAPSSGLRTVSELGDPCVSALSAECFNLFGSRARLAKSANAEATLRHASMATGRRESLVDTMSS